jgi:gluconolactonase
VGLDGVRVIEASGHAIGHIHLPERCANVCFGSSHSLYALYVNVQGAA